MGLARRGVVEVRKPVGTPGARDRSCGGWEGQCLRPGTPSSCPVERVTPVMDRVKGLSLPDLRPVDATVNHGEGEGRGRVVTGVLVTFSE